jgi:hypothetical protein
LKYYFFVMDAALKKINLALQEAADAFEGPLNQHRLEHLQTLDSLPDKELWNLASQTIDLADRVIRKLQPPSLQLAESFLGELLPESRHSFALVSPAANNDYFHSIS